MGKCCLEDKRVFERKMVVRKRLSCCFPFTMYLALLILDYFWSGSPFILHLGSTATECQELPTQNNCPSISSCPVSLVSPNILSGLTDSRQDLFSKSVLLKSPGSVPVRSILSTNHLLGSRPISKDAFSYSNFSALQQSILMILFLYLSGSHLKPRHGLLAFTLCMTPWFCPLFLIAFQNHLCPPCHLGPNLWGQGSAHGNS